MCTISKLFVACDLCFYEFYSSRRNFTLFYFFCFILFYFIFETNGKTEVNKIVFGKEVNNNCLSLI